MSEIPDDIKKRASKIVSATRVLDHVDRETFEGLLLEHLSVALTAERERCAEIIEARLPIYTEVGQINALRECISSIRNR